MRQFLLTSLLSLVFMATQAASDVRNWEYIGIQNPGTLAEAFVAETSIDDDSLRLLYFTEDQTYYLWFEYYGEMPFSDKFVEESEFFMRTRIEPKLSGRYDSDYVFSGRTVTQPDRNPAMPQIVVVALTDSDIEALRAYEKNQIIGVGYFLSSGYWRTYSFPAQGVWSAYLLIKDDVERSK